MTEEPKDTCDMIGSQKTNPSRDKDLAPYIKIKVLFFARARDLTGSTELCLEMPDGSTARDCMNKLLIEFPNLREIYNSMVLALNEEYVPESTVLRNKDELAIIPPISGG
ncbi:unnamed protein product [Musa acuminata subsp. burmannicoides]